MQLSDTAILITSAERGLGLTFGRAALAHGARKACAIAGTRPAHAGSSARAADCLQAVER